MNTYAIISDKMLQIGDQFDHYQIQAYMAQGGMSDIYRAFDLINHREVVIKVPDQTMLGDSAQFERFQREMDVMKTLDHPAILKGLGSGKYNRIIAAGFDRNLRATAARSGCFSHPKNCRRDGLLPQK